MQIPDELRTDPDKTEKPLARFQYLTKVSCESLHVYQIFVLCKECSFEMLCVLKDFHISLLEYIQELIRRCDSERELFYHNIVHVEASVYAH